MARPVCFDEMRGSDDGIRAPYQRVADWLEATPTELLSIKQLEADTLFRRMGITFVVYGDGGSTERLMPRYLNPRNSCHGTGKRLNVP